MNFKKIYIEITNVCNLSCDFCPKTKREPSFMSEELFERILQQVCLHGEYIYFHVKGEPFLHPKLSLFLDLCEKYGVYANITTNGTLIERVGKEIINKPALRQVNFSLHSFDANIQGRDTEHYFRDIFSFCKKAMELGKPMVSLRLWNLEESVEGPFRIGKEEMQKNNYILEDIERTFSLDYKLEEKWGNKRGIKIAENIFLNQASRFQWPEKEQETQDEEGFCYGLREQIGVLADGTVIPCCLDGEGAIALGNIVSEPLASILDGERARNIYEGFSKRKVVEDLCKSCDYRRRFGK